MGLSTPNSSPSLKVKGVGSSLETTNTHNKDEAPLKMHGANDLGSFQKDGDIDIPLNISKSYFMDKPTFGVHVPSNMCKSNSIPI